MSQQPKITIRTIAELCGVSVSTVSLAINNKPGVRAEVRALIKKCVGELGWKSNSILGKFRPDRQMSRPAFVLNGWQPATSGGNPLASTISKAVEKFGDDGIFPAVFYGHCREVLETCLEQHFNPVVLLSNNELLLPQVERLKKNGCRVLVAHAEWREAVCPRIHSDHRGAGRGAASVLKEAGCERPAFMGAFGGLVRVSGPEQLPSPANAYIDGIREIYPEFDFRRDAAGDACGDPSEVIKMLESNRYDGWIFQYRQFFNRFSFLAESRNSRRTPYVVFDTDDLPVYPLAKQVRFSENCEKIADLIYRLSVSESEPEPMEYSIPYLREEPFLL